MKRLIALCWTGLLLVACGGDPSESNSATEQDFYAAIARSDVRYALLTRSEGVAEVQTFGNEVIRFTGIENMEDAAATLSKEHIEHHLQERRVVRMAD